MASAKVLSAKGIDEHRRADTTHKICITAKLRFLGTRDKHR